MKNKINKLFILSLGFLSLPFFTFAAGKTLSDIIVKVTMYFNSILVLLMGFAVVMFVWYVIQYFIKPNEDRKNANTYVLYSVIGFFVVLSVWGIVNILTNTFGLENASPSWSTIQNLFPGGGSSNTTSNDLFDSMTNSGNRDSMTNND